MTPIIVLNQKPVSQDLRCGIAAEDAFYALHAEPIPRWMTELFRYVARWFAYLRELGAATRSFSSNAGNPCDPAPTATTE